MSAGDDRGTTCNYCGDPPEECTHRETWWRPSADYAVKIEKTSREFMSRKETPNWTVSTENFTESSGRFKVFGSLDEAIQYARDRLDEWGVEPEDVDLVARNCTVSKEELAGTRKLAAFA